MINYHPKILKPFTLSWPIINGFQMQFFILAKYLKKNYNKSQKNYKI